MLLAIAGCAQTGAGSADEPQSPEAPPHPVTTISGDPIVSCGGDDGWPASVMSAGVPGLLDEAEARDTFRRILQDPRLAGETELSLLSDGVDVEYRVLRGDDISLTLGLGRWTDKGPAEANAYELRLEREANHWVPRGWGSCTLLGPVREFA